MAITAGIKALFNKITKRDNLGHENDEPNKILKEDDKVSQNVRKHTSDANKEIKHESEETITAPSDGAELN